MKEKNEEKYTITDLVKNSNEEESLITGALANAHLLTEYYKELKQKQLGLKIDVKLTKKEFNNLVEKFKNKEV